MIVDNTSPNKRKMDMAVSLGEQCKIITVTSAVSFPVQSGYQQI